MYRKISNWKKGVLSENTTIHSALSYMNEFGLNYLIFVNSDGRMNGVLTDGDIRRKLTTEDNFDLSRACNEIMNANFDFVTRHSAKEKLTSLNRKFIPVLDDFRRPVSVLTQAGDEISIEGKVISRDSPTFFIAEIGNNHNGDYELAVELVNAAIGSGADCVKFQMRQMSSLYAQHSIKDKAFDLGTEYTLDLLSKFQLRNEELFRLFDLCWSNGVVPMCTPWDQDSLEILDKFGLNCFKIASADLTNAPLLEAAAQKNKPLFLSTGMSTTEEIQRAVDGLDAEMAEYFLLHCNSTYPTPYKDINLKYLMFLKKFGRGIVGYSGHERGIHVPIAAVANGCKIIEKHFTFDRMMEGNDHKVSLLPDEFEKMVLWSRDIESALGDEGSVRKVSQGELINRENLAKSLYPARTLKKGSVVGYEDIIVKSPGTGIQPDQLPLIINKKLMRDKDDDAPFYIDDFSSDQGRKSRFNFKSKWGFPLRYHDAPSLMSMSNPRMIEIHLSYKDIGKDLPVLKNFDKDFEIVVHTPELFEGDQILDLSLEDGKALARSMSNMQKTIDEALRIRQLTYSSNKVRIVFNAGGATSDTFISSSDRLGLYENLAENLSRLNALKEVELLPQSMPPFPWHFGGQRFHNLFVDPKECISFCEKFGYSICLDISHTKLACNHYKLSFNEAISDLLPYARHLHIADAAGTDGEGLQVGEGEIDWPELGEIMMKNLDINCTWIPEIWQGHTNNNAGAFKALCALEGIMP